MCRTNIRKEVLNVVQSWLDQCNEDINYNLERILDPHANRNLLELYDRKIQLVRFMAIYKDGNVGYDRTILCDAVDYLTDMEDELERMDQKTAA